MSSRPSFQGSSEPCYQLGVSLSGLRHMVLSTNLSLIKPCYRARVRGPACLGPRGPAPGPTWGGPGPGLGPGARAWARARARACMVLSVSGVRAWS